MKVKISFSHPIYQGGNKPKVKEIIYDGDNPKNSHNKDVTGWLHLTVPALDRIARGEMDWVKIETVKNKK